MIESRDSKSSVEQHRNVEKNVETLLLTLGELFPEAPELITKTAQMHVIPMQRWEIVRKDRGPLVMQRTTSASGFEGYLIGPHYSSDQIEYYIAKSIEDELNRSVREHPTDSYLRSRMERSLFDAKFDDLVALKYLERIFNLSRVNLQREHIANTKKEIQAANENFRLQTQRAANSVARPTLSFDTKTGKYSQDIIIPHVQTEAPAYPNLGLPIPQTGKTFAKEIGIVGHPIIRAALSFDALVTYFELRHPRRDAVNYVWKGSKLREEFKDRLAFRFLTDLINRY